MLDFQRIPPPRFPDVRLRTPPNWTAVSLLALLGGVHLAIAVPAAFHGRWEGSLSFLFAAVFLFAAFIARRWYVEIALLPSRRQIRVRTGTQRWYAERLLAFEEVTAVRLTFDVLKVQASQIEILCPKAPIECPPTPIPHEEALFLSMMLEVPLVKISESETPPAMDSTSTFPMHHEGTKDEKASF